MVLPTELQENDDFARGGKEITFYFSTAPSADRNFHLENW